MYAIRSYYVWPAVPIQAVAIAVVVAVGLLAFRGADLAGVPT